MNNYNKLFFSDYSPSMDHFKLNYKKNNFDYNYLLIKLNNDLITNEDLDENKYINRWMYYRDFTIKINKNTSLTFIESIISTGENRNIEWYYLTPLGLFIAEQMHNTDREDNGINDSLEENNSSSFNNDNSFLGMSLSYAVNSKVSLDASIIIDDLQIDKEGMDKYQDSFGFSFGLNYLLDNLSFKLNYNYASPWLYLNNGLFTNYTHHNYPIGLRYPHFHQIKFELEYSDDNSKINSYFLIGEKGDQTFNTPWNNGNCEETEEGCPKEFTTSLPLEIYFKYSFLTEKKYIPNIIISHNWMESEQSNVILEWEFSKNIFKNIN